MNDHLKPEEILNSTTNDVRNLIEEILKLEKDYQYIKNLEDNTSKEKEISKNIIAIIEKINIS